MGSRVCSKAGRQAKAHGHCGWSMSILGTSAEPYAASFEGDTCCLPSCTLKPLPVERGIDDYQMGQCSVRVQAVGDRCARC